MMNKKIEFLDFIRVIATVSVFASHIIFLFWTNNAAVQDLWQTPAVSYSSEWFSKLCHYFRGINFGPFGVALFFLISGFTFLPSAGKSVKPFWWKKFIRIYPIYWGGGIRHYAMVVQPVRTRQLQIQFERYIGHCDFISPFLERSPVG